jgi:uncharacterized radical SAM protein YgiQ
MFLPTSKQEMQKQGFDRCDVVIVTPDAYVDHPSFAMAILGRFLEKHGYKVGILSQPDWKNPESFLELGIPKIAFAVSGGQADPMVINYTAKKIPRKEDRFCDEGNPFFSKKGEGKKYRIRPDRTIPVYCNQIRSACKDVPIIIGGIESSLRRIAHYDFWSDKIRRSILLDSKADILIYGMGEFPFLETVQNLEEGIPPEEIRVPNTAVIRKDTGGYEDAVFLPSFNEVEESKEKFAEAWKLFEKIDDRNVLVQKYDTRYYVQQPKRQITQEELDYIYDLEFERRPHPKYKRIPAFDMIETSVTSHRGCFGNCSFCAISAHQGKEIVSRSRESILKEVEKIAKGKKFRGTITDIGGPTANMYGSTCTSGGCKTHDCLKSGSGCKNFVPGTKEYISILNDALKIPNVKRIQINSGIRYEPCILDDITLRSIIENFVSGRMKVAPESGSDKVLDLMNKPCTKVFENFFIRFGNSCKTSGKKCILTPYLIVGHPGEGETENRETSNFLKKFRLPGSHSQIFTPTPMTRSTAMYYLGYDPVTGERAESEKDRKKLEKRKTYLLNRS